MSKFKVGDIVKLVDVGSNAGAENGQFFTVKGVDEPTKWGTLLDVTRVGDGKPLGLFEKRFELVTPYKPTDSGYEYDDWKLFKEVQDDPSSFARKRLLDEAYEEYEVREAAEALAAQPVAPKFKVGDRLVFTGDDQFPELKGREFTVKDVSEYQKPLRSADLAYAQGYFYEGDTADSRYGIWESQVELSVPKPKFKVGDTVKVGANGSKFEITQVSKYQPHLNLVELGDYDYYYVGDEGTVGESGKWERNLTLVDPNRERLQRIEEIRAEIEDLVTELAELVK